jgi:putative ABC transport system permease protein
VLGAAAAHRLGIDRVFAGERVWLGSQWFYVAEILARTRDRHLRSGRLQTYLCYDGHRSAIYVRARTDSVVAVQSVLAATASPESLNEVDVSQPSAAVVA